MLPFLTLRSSAIWLANVRRHHGGAQRTSDVCTRCLLAWTLLVRPVWPSTRSEMLLVAIPGCCVQACRVGNLLQLDLACRCAPLLNLEILSNSQLPSSANRRG